MLVDGTNIVHAAAYGAGVDRAAGTVAKRLRDLIDHFKPYYVVTAWDSGPSFRSDLYDSYKAGRKRLPGVDEAIESSKSLCGDMSIGVLTMQGYEADDILATLSTMAVQTGDKAIFYSSDRDLHQMIIDRRVCQLKQAKRVAATGDSFDWDFRWCNAVILQTDYGVRPDQWCEYKMMVGDPSDNIRGADGVGDKTAARILETCGSLAGYFKTPGLVRLTARQEKGMDEMRERMDLLRELVTLRRDVPLPIDCLETAYVGEAA